MSIGTTVALPWFVVAAFAALTGLEAALAAAPDWVPPEYARFVYRNVNERPAWQRALGYLHVPVGETGRSFALVVGVSKYPNMSGPSADLWPARLDAEKMVAYLESEPESFNEIVVLLDADVTAQNLRYFLTEYFPQRLSETKRSRFLFAYSGHGMTAENGRGYLLTSEARNLEDRYHAGISMAELRVQFEEIVDFSNPEKGHQILALINACYGVDFHRMTLAFGDEGPARPTREGAHAITAGGAGELTWHDPTFGLGDGPKGSIFFEAVFAALDGRADKLPADGIVSVGELETYLRTTVSVFTDERQNPSGGDMVSTRSPGCFYFLDRGLQMEKDNAAPLSGEWWGGVSFGEDVAAAGAEAPAAEHLPTADEIDHQALARLESAGQNPFVGTWSGVATEPGGFNFDVELEVREGCELNGPCGWIAVPHVPCRGRLTLIDRRDGEAEFNVDQFDAASDKDICQPGGGEVLRPLSDGTLEYRATYSGAVGVLSRTPR